MRLGYSGVRWLKVFHLLFVSMWLGGAIALTLCLWMLSRHAGPDAHGVNRAMKLIDDCIVIPGALGCLATGFLYSLFTAWGFIRHYWVVVKWVVTLASISFGTFWLGPWLNGMESMTGHIGPQATNEAQYLSYLAGNSRGALAQVAVLTFACYISTFKPWGPSRTTRKSEYHSERMDT